MTSAILLDTCAVLWIAQDEPIHIDARAEIEQAVARATPVYVSPMTAWELGLLAARGRIKLASPPARWFASFMASPGLVPAPLTPTILVESSFLPATPPNDPVDRIMAATARELECRLMTRDRRLLDYSEAGHIRAIAC